MNRAFVFLFAMLAAALSWAAEENPSAGSADSPATASDKAQEPFAALSGKELISKLLAGETRSHAYYELWRRANPKGDEGYKDFLETHYDLRVVPCSQGKGSAPIYIVLHGFLPRFDDYVSPGSYPVENLEALFPPNPERDKKRGEEDGPAIDAFTADGKRIEPFGGNNVLEGLLEDINGDGLVERVDTTSYGMEGIDSVEVLHVSAVKLTSVPLLDVLFNWGKGDEWTYRVRKAADGGPAEIEIGPVTKDGFKAKAVYRWDAGKQSYVGPEGGKGDHFRRLSSGDPGKQLKAFKAAGLAFPEDPDALDEESVVSAASSSGDGQPKPPVAKPYERKSLAGLSTAELISRMSPGRAEYEFEWARIRPNTLPDSFWKVDPRKAALALVAANTSEKRRVGYEDALDDRDRARPPEVGSLSVSVGSSLCYNAVNAYYFVRIDPEDSYLAYARTWSGGAVFYNFVFDQPAFDLRLCRLSYDEARHIGAVVWWLDRVRSRARGENSGFSGMSSTADGMGDVTLRDAGGKVLAEREGTVWSAPMSECFAGAYDHSSFVNFSAFLVTEVLTKRLGKAWEEAEPRHDQNTITRQEHGPIYTEEELRHYRDLVTRFLGWVSPGRERISYVIAAVAADAAGTLVVPEAKPLLQKIETAIPVDTKKRRTYEEVFEEQSKLLSEMAANDKAPEELERKWEALTAEAAEISAATAFGSPNQLREAAALALRQIEAADNPSALLAWATSEEPGCQWAFQRLSQLDKAKYAEALEWWMKKLPPKLVRQVYDELARVAPDRALEIAAKLPPGKNDALSVPAFSLLQQSGKLSDEKERLTALMAIVQDPKSGWEQRGEALNLLVPPNEPLKYPQREIDDMLLRALDPDQADEVVNFTRAAAMRSLALRQRSEAYERIEKIFAAEKDPMAREGFLGPLALMVQSDPAKLEPRFREIIAPHLKETNMRMSEILWAIWVADLRELKPELERLGTSGPDDYEDGKASSSGGAASAVGGRFHLARNIADVWNVQDALTRAKLLSLLMLTDSYYFLGDDAAERAKRMQTELGRTGRELTPKERERLEVFFEELKAASSESRRFPDKETREKLVEVARAAVKGE